MCFGSDSSCLIYFDVIIRETEKKDQASWTIFSVEQMK